MRRRNIKTLTTSRIIAASVLLLLAAMGRSVVGAALENDAALEVHAARQTGPEEFLVATE